MLAGPAILCLLTSLISAEQLCREPRNDDTGEVHVTIHLDGDHARRYSVLINSPEAEASFKATGTLLLPGVATVIDENRSRIRHTAIVRVVGQPLELLSMESEISSALISMDRPPSATEKKDSCQLLVRLTDVHPMTIRVRKVVGGFPDSARYQ